MSGLLTIAMLSAAAGAVVMLLGVAASHSLNAKSRNVDVTISDGLSSSPGGLSETFSASSLSADDNLDLAGRAARPQAFSSSNQIL